jgi:hypothetical protein
MTGEVGAGKHGAMRRAILRGALVGLGLGIVLGVLVVLSLESSLCGSAANCAVSGTGLVFLIVGRCRIARWRSSRIDSRFPAGPAQTVLIAAKSAPFAPSP